METQTLQVFQLRGMDERWITQPQDALYIQDMTWTSNDSWRTSGGFVQLFQPDKVVIELPPTQQTSAPQQFAFKNVNQITSDQAPAPEEKILDQVAVSKKYKKAATDLNVLDAYGNATTPDDETDDDLQSETEFDRYNIEVDSLPSSLSATVSATGSVSTGSSSSAYSVEPFSASVEDTPDAATGAIVTPEEGVNTYGKINSIHWFAQHNGARQWLIYEEENYAYDPVSATVKPDGTTTLKAFDGSRTKRFAYESFGTTPFRVLQQYREPGSEIKIEGVAKRHKSELSYRTQSQAYGGRIYFVNGFDEPLVFDGDICERAGFSDRPPAPVAQASEPENSTTFPIACGDGGHKLTLNSCEVGRGNSADTDTFERVIAKRPRSRGHYGLHKNVKYFGLGASSSAIIGAGTYRFIGASKVPYHGNEFINDAQLRYNYYSGGQEDNRPCGFQYRVTYVNDRGQESDVSSPSGIAVVRNGSGGEKKAAHGKGLIALDVPIGPKECVARRIYRTRNVFDSRGNLYRKGGQETFYFLTQISDNMTTRFVDGHPDTALGDLLELRNYGNFPQRTKFLALFKNTMFAAGDDFNEVSFSAPLFPEVFPSDNVITVGDDDGGPITGMRATKNALVVFKTRGIYLIKGDSARGFAAQTLNKDIGCIAPDSIVEVPGLGLAFLSEKSVYLLEGALEESGTVTRVINIGGEIPSQVERINRAAAIRASAVIYQRDKEFWLSVPVDGSSENNLCLVYHYEVGSWSVRKDMPIDCMVVSKDHRGYLFMGSHDNKNDFRSGILVYTRGVASKGSTTISLEADGAVIETKPVAIQSIYETVSNDYASAFSTFRPAHIMAYAVGYGDNPMTVDTRVNRSIETTRSLQPRGTAQDSDQQDPNETYPVYGSALFNQDKWIAYRPTVLRFDVSTSHRGPVRELSILFAAGDGNKIELIGYDLEAKVGEQRKIKALNKALRPQGR